MFPRILDPYNLQTHLSGYTYTDISTKINSPEPGKILKLCAKFTSTEKMVLIQNLDPDLRHQIGMI